MRDYAELVKAIRYCSEHDNCGSRCPRFERNEDCVGQLAKDAADAIEELLAELTTIRKQFPRWTSVEERLPEIGEIVLAYVDELGLIIRAKIADAKDYRGERRIDWARVDQDPFFLSCYTITHWMPLPGPPKGD